MRTQAAMTAISGASTMPASAAATRSNDRLANDAAARPRGGRLASLSNGLLQQLRKLRSEQVAVVPLLGQLPRRCSLALHPCPIAQCADHGARRGADVVGTQDQAGIGLDRDLRLPSGKIVGDRLARG